ncbi:MAG: YbbR-like domain-containing protein [Proteobacteria bacterium]|nr:YbbR-like domain-containing protein [Pseudomonadota bacterium]MBU1688850.1 YbbR-like domain-containing protein [Pseudomonadota bacterium]
MEKLAQQNIKTSWVSQLHWPKDWILKILSLFFALLLWYFVVGEDKVDMTVLVPIEITNLPQDMVISNQFMRQLEVTVSGPRGLVRGLDRLHISKPVDLSQATPGSKVIQTKPESIKFPRGIKVLRIQPANVSLVIDRLIQKELPIKPTTSGSPAEGYELVGAVPDPVSLSLTAPAKLMEGLLFLSTEPIDLSGVKASFTKQIPLDLAPEITRLVGEPVITVRGGIREKRVPKTLYHLPITFTHTADRTLYQLSRQEVDIKVELPYFSAQSMESTEGITAVIDGASLPPGTYSLPVVVTIPNSQIKLLEVVPAEIVLTIGEAGPLLKIKPAVTMNP